MKCLKCGNELNDGVAFCPNCGSKVENQTVANPVESNPLNTNNTVSPVNNISNASSNPGIVKKNLATQIILSIVTCGIYGIIWFINLVNDVNKVTDADNEQSGVTVFLLTLITCGIYSWIWFYRTGKNMEIAGQKYGKNISNNSTIYIILSICKLDIVNYCLVQNDLNTIAE